MKKVTASAPGKLILFGEHAVVDGSPCIVTAVDQRISATVQKNGVDIFHLEAPDLGLAAYSKTIPDLGKKDLPKAVRFIELLYKHFLRAYPQKEGIIVTTKSGFSSSFGFGSSSAVTVAFAKALLTLYKISLSKKELFDFCYKAVLDVQGVGSGFDIAAAIWGGTLYYVKPAKVTEQLAISNMPFIVGYTGIKADTPTLIRLVQSQKNTDADKIKTIFSEIARIVEQAKIAIKQKNWQKVGKLMQQNQACLRNLQVSTLELEKLITASIKAGAHGAKLSGAGGGDCMIATTNESKKLTVYQAIRENGGEVMDVKLNAAGVRLEV